MTKIEDAINRLREESLPGAAMPGPGTPEWLQFWRDLDVVVAHARLTEAQINNRVRERVIAENQIITTHFIHETEDLKDKIDRALKMVNDRELRSSVALAAVREILTGNDELESVWPLSDQPR